MPLCLMWDKPIFALQKCLMSSKLINKALGIIKLLNLQFNNVYIRELSIIRPIDNRIIKSNYEINN